MAMLNEVLNSMIDSQEITQPKAKSVGKQPKRKLTIGVPKERGDGEQRTALASLSVEMIRNENPDVEIFVETGAGALSGFSDHLYTMMGATIVQSAAEAYGCDIVLTVRHPSPKEVEMMKENSILFTSILSGCFTFESIDAMARRKITAISREFINSSNVCSPIVHAVLPIDAKAAVLMAAELLCRKEGILLGGVAGIRPVEMVVFGASVTAEYVAQTAMVLGTSVKVFGFSQAELEGMKRRVGQSLYTSLMYPTKLKDALEVADVVIFTIDVRHKNETFYVGDSLFSLMKKDAIVIDMAAITQTTWDENKNQILPNPRVLKKYGVFYYPANNISSRVPCTASKALSDLHVVYAKRLFGTCSLPVILYQNPDLRDGVYMYRGVLVSPPVGKKFKLPYQDINLLLCTQGV